MAVEKKKKQSAFMRWYTSYNGKNVVNIVYSIGASVVIVGALFKIMHWPGAGIVLTAGMVTEAILFIIGVLEHPHEEYHWGNVFPQLLEYGTEQDRLDVAAKQAVPTLLGVSGSGGSDAHGGESSSSNQSGFVLSDDDYTKIHDSFKALTRTAEQMSDLSGMVGASSKLKDKMEQACDSADQFLKSQNSLKSANDNYLEQLKNLSSLLSTSGTTLNQSYSEITGEMRNIVAGTKNYQEQLQATEKNVAALNAVYELQVKAAEQQMNDFKKQNEQLASVSKIMDSFVGDMGKIGDVMGKSIQNHDDYLKQTELLNKQLSDLNKVYGGMLNALS